MTDKLGLVPLVEYRRRMRAKSEAPRTNGAGADITPDAAAALAAALIAVGSVGEGTRNSRLKQAAVSVGRLVREGAINRDRGERALAGVTARIGLPAREAAGIIASGLDAGMRQPRPAPSAASPAAISRRSLKSKSSRTTQPINSGESGLADTMTLDEAERDHWQPPQATKLIDLASAGEFFHTPGGISFADVRIKGHRETWPCRSKGFRRWLARRFFETTGGAPNSEAMQSALNMIEARAHFDAPEREIHIRVAGHDGRIYLDLADEKWRAVEIDTQGWRVIENPPVRFRRAAGMKSLPTPLSGGSVETLRGFLNVKSDTDFVLAVAWLLAALRDCGPYPVLILSGEQRTAKSSLAGILRSLIDPNTAALRALSREDRDLFIAANNGHVLAFDNVSNLQPWISDTLCRLATGGGFAVRQLYTDADEMLFDATRPVILNGIEDVVTRPDLADRAVFLELQQIPDDRRQPEKKLWAEFEAEKPRILGALLDAVAHGLRMLPETRLDRLPRMADFALWVTACETAIWPAGTFGAAYTGNRDEAVVGVIEADSIAAALRTFMAERTVWTGTAADLLDALGKVASDRIVKGKNWPESPRGLSGRMRRAMTPLRKIGIGIDFKQEGKGRTRTIHITAAENRGARPSAPSAASANPPDTSQNNDLPADGWQTGGNEADGPTVRQAHTVRQTVRHNPLKTNGENAADGADGRNPPLSGDQSIKLENHEDVVAEEEEWTG